MRNPIGYIALSLLAAAFAGCSSTDTGSNPSSTGGQEPLTGPLAVYQAKLSALTGTCTFDSATKALTVGMVEATDKLIVLSKRSVDSAVLVNGDPCVDTDVTPNVTALSTNVKTIAVGPDTGENLDGTDQTVLIDIRNGTFATKSGTTGGITIDLGTAAATDEVAVLGATTADKLGCKLDADNGDMIGLKSATSQDITLTHAVTKVTIDLNDGDDSFDQGACTTPFTVYGSAGKDTIIAGSVKTANDTYSGGTEADTLSYANRTAAVVINASTTDETAPFAMVSLKAGESGEADTITDDFEVLTSGSGNDKIRAGETQSSYTLNGGAGDDTFVSVTTFPAVMNGGTGTDTADYSARATAVTANMLDGKALDGETDDTDNIAKDVENYIASAHGDTVTGNASNNVFTGGAGDDTFNGGAGDDTFLASAAADGDDIFNGGDGSDTMDYSARTATGACIYLDGAATSGKCTVAVALGVMSVSAAPATGDLDTIAVDVENAVGTTGADYMVGSAVANKLSGYGGGDWFEGGAGNDFIDADSSAGVCSNTAVQVDCGGDPLDVVTCTGTAATDNMADTSSVWTTADTNCWKIQN